MQNILQNVIQTFKNEPKNTFISKNELSARIKKMFSNHIEPKICCKKIKQFLSRGYQPEDILKEITKHHRSIEASPHIRETVRLLDRKYQKILLGVNPGDMPNDAFDRLMSAYIDRSESLDLSESNIKKLPKNIGQLLDLKELILEYNELQELPDSICDLVGLRKLNASNNQINHVPEQIEKLVNLQKLSLSANLLTDLPEGFGGLTNLQNLNLNNNYVVEFPSSFSNLSNLKILNLSMNELTQVPEYFGNFTNLEHLNLIFNKITHVPESLANLSAQINLNGNRFSYDEVLRIRNLLSSSEASVQIDIYESQQQRRVPQIFDAQSRIFQDYDNTNLVSQVEALKQAAKIHGIQKVFKNDTVWESFNNSENNAFKQFLDKLWQTKDGGSNPKIMLNVVMDIFERMETNSSYAKHCLSIAEESVNTCGDRVALGMVQMQLVQKGYPTNTPSLRELYHAESTMAKADLLFAIVREKVSNMTGVIDEIETYLKYCKDLQSELEIDIHAMLYEGMSNVSKQDIQEAKKRLQSIPKETIFQRLLENPTIQQRYHTEFTAIQEQDKYDTFGIKANNEQELLLKMSTLQQELETEKRLFLQKELTKKS